MTGIVHDRIAAEQLAADVAATEAARRTVSASGEPGYEVLLSLANVVAWTVAASVLSRAGLGWSSYAWLVPAVLATQLPLWLRARRLRRQLDAALLLLAKREPPTATDPLSGRSPSARR